jgi:hypothetical protein
MKQAGERADDLAAMFGRRKPLSLDLAPGVTDNAATTFTDN